MCTNIADKTGLTIPRQKIYFLSFIFRLIFLDYYQKIPLFSLCLFQTNFLWLYYFHCLFWWLTKIIYLLLLPSWPIINTDFNLSHFIYYLFLLFFIICFQSIFFIFAIFYFLINNSKLLLHLIYCLIILLLYYCMPFCLPVLSALLSILLLYWLALVCWRKGFEALGGRLRSGMTQ